MIRKIILERDCDWFGVNGKHYRTERYLEAIWHGSVDEEPSLNKGAYGAVVGGSWWGDKDVSFFNACLAEGEKPVTVEDIKKAIESARAELKEVQ